MLEISNILNEIAQLLEQCDYHDRKKIHSLRKWAEHLASNSPVHEKVSTLLKVKSIIAGMNSLSDIRLSFPASSVDCTEEANLELNEMTMKLDRLVLEKLGSYKENS